MKLKLNTFLLALSFAGYGAAQAQHDHFRCGQYQATQKMWEQDPQVKAELEIFKERVRMSAQYNPVTQKTVYTIPLVFHIIHEYGEENISDAQVYDQIDILNEAFRKQNADISELVAGYDTLAADAQIEFRLATIGPNGECTNGIEHIYSHEVRSGDDYSKLNQWHRSRYLNIWTVNNMMDGYAGYAYQPNDGLDFYRDGIIILHQYIGSIGTGNEERSSALTHEFGHYLGLDHCWGGGDPGVACGDDGIPDTPETKGFDFCPATLAEATVCNPPIVENYQNYMEYSYCSVMFTKDQVEFMRNSLLVETANRSNLVKDSNLIITGALVNPAPLCAPVADFSTWVQGSGSTLTRSKFACEGDVITFKDASWNAATLNRTWYFQDGTPATSTEANPEVTFSGLGWKQVKLVVSNATGQDSTIDVQAIHISQSWADKTGPYTENFESGNVVSWLVDNPEYNYAKWQLSDAHGKDNSKCMVLNNFKDVSSAQLYTDEYFYNFRLGGNRDALITPSFDLTTTTGSELIFDYSYATNGTVQADITETLKVYVSKNCGKTWVLRETLALTELLTAGNSAGISFVPTTNTQWKTASVPVVINSQDARTRFKFEFNASDVSNNLYLDNIRVTGTLDVSENPLNTMDIVVYPNPSSHSEGISISYTANASAVDFQLLDVQGKVLATETNQTTNAEVTHKLNTGALAAGCYYVKVSQGDFNMTKKVVVM